MSNIIKSINLLSLIFLTSFLSYKIAFMVGENYFFDKLFYYKSIEHGYWVPDKDIRLDDFGERSEDLLMLDSIWQERQDKNILGKTTQEDDVLTIALIGDSYVWGQGVSYENSLPYLLEKELNKTIKTNVISLAECGDSVLDFWENYHKSSNLYDVDLFIFMPVENDIMISHEFESLEKRNSIPFWDTCQKKYDKYEITYDLYNDENTNYEFDKRLRESWNNEFGLCLLDEFLQIIPKEKSLFIISHDSYFNFRQDTYYPEGVLAWTNYIKYLKKHNKNLVFAEESKKDNKYKKYWDDLQNFRVSEKETHPSKIANEIYTYVLKNKILETIE